MTRPRSPMRIHISDTGKVRAVRMSGEAAEKSCEEGVEEKDDGHEG